ncbi:MAG: restriction endonuclease [Cellulosilyticaceae bacterium]
MDHKIIRTLLLIGAIVLGYGLVMRSQSPMESIGMIVLVALLLLSMENIKRKRAKIFETHSSLECIDEMSAVDFVAYIADLYKRIGYYIQGIKSEEDMGCDLIVSKQKEKIAIYCENQLDILSKDAVQKVYGSMNHYHCKQGMIITNKCLDEDAMTLARDNHIKVVQRQQLMNLVAQVIRSDSQINTKEESSGSMA